MGACPITYWVVEKACTVLHISLNVKKKKYTLDTEGGLHKTYTHTKNDTPVWEAELGIANSSSRLGIQDLKSETLYGIKVK